MIDIAGLTKTYGIHKVVDDFTIHITKGEIFGLLGPNGAGKSTTIRMLCTIIKPDSGKAKIAGFDLFSQSNEIKERIGYMSQNFGLYSELSVMENVRFYANLYGIFDEEKMKKLLKVYHIDHFSHYKVRELSGGYKRRLSLVCALVHDPKILFLDEPTAGIDPATRKELWDLFFKLSAEGKTLFVTTHYMEEAKRCNRVAFLNYGKMVALDTPKSLESSLGDTHAYAYEGDFDLKMIDFLKSCKDIVLVNQFGNIVKILTNHQLDKTVLENMLKPFIKQKYILKPAHIDLEDVFIVKTQEKYL